MVLHVSLLSVVTITKLLYRRKVDGLSSPEEVFHLASWLTWFLHILDWGNMKDVIDLPSTMASSYYIYRRRSEWKGRGVGIMNHALPPGIQRRTSRDRVPVIYSSQPLLYCCQFIARWLESLITPIRYHIQATVIKGGEIIFRFHFGALQKRMSINYIGHTTLLAILQDSIDTTDYCNKKLMQKKVFANA